MSNVKRCCWENSYISNVLGLNVNISKIEQGSADKKREHSFLKRP